MKAAIYTRYGPPDVVQIRDVEKPVPKDNQVRIEVRAAALNALDWRVMRGRPLVIRLMLGGLRKPRGAAIAGVDLAGRVETCGKNVSTFKPGDEVFGASEGAFAEYACINEEKATNKPTDISFEDVAALPVAALTALQGLRDYGRVQPGQQVLIDGASGGVGTYAIQIARSLDAEVTAVTSTSKLETARSLGAHHVIDYTKEDFTRSARRYDLIFAANAHHPLLDYRRALAPNGVFVLAGGGWNEMLQAVALGPFLSMTGKRKFRFVMAKVNKADLDRLIDLLATGKMVSVIDRRYPLREAAEAIRYLEEGHARGKVVMTFAGGPQ